MRGEFVICDVGGTFGVINGDMLEIQFKSGIVMKQRISYYE